MLSWITEHIEGVLTCFWLFSVSRQSSKYYTPSVLNTMHEGIPAYATSDLVAPHPTKPNYWKVYGRADDQLMHSTGEKVCTLIHPP